MRRTRVWARLLGVKGVIVEEVATEEDEDGELAAIATRLRLPLVGRAHRPSLAQPWRSLPAPSGALVTHGSVTRAKLSTNT